MDGETDMNIDEKAQEYIRELETKVDLLEAYYEDAMEENKILKAQIRAIQNGQKVDYCVA
jgi:hypothetical protein